MSEIKGLVISVGGAPAPVKAALDEADPRFVLFVVSSGSKAQVEGSILPAISGAPPQWECLMVTDHQSIETCYAEIRRGLAGWLKRRDLGDREVAVDITCATKAMSAALALAAVERLSTFRYVGGDARNRRNLGVVDDGSEQVFESRNPWNTYAVRDLERASVLMRGYYADLAAEVLGGAAERCDNSMRTKLTVLSSLVRSFAHADRFDFKSARASYRRYYREVPFVVRDDSLAEQAKTAFSRWKRLNEQTKDSGRTPGRETVLELIANADRRAVQSRYDDAVGRLYRAVELHVQGLAKERFGDELGRLRLQSLPGDAARSWMRREYGEPTDGSYKLGIEALFRVLRRFGGLPHDQTHSYDELKNHLQKRNNSLFAHGSIPVKERDYQEFRGAVLEEMSIPADDVPAWPDLGGVLERIP